MEEKPKNVETLREVMKKAAARDADLQKVLETTAINVLKDLGFGNGPPEWAEIKAASAKERQVTPHFTLEDKWLRGDLVFKLAPEGAPSGPAPAAEGQAAQPAEPAEPSGQPPPNPQTPNPEKTDENGQPAKPEDANGQAASPPPGQPQQFVVSMTVREGPKHTHEAGTLQQRSQTVIIDPPDEKDLNEARKKFAEIIFMNLDGQIRSRFAFPET